MLDNDLKSIITAMKWGRNIFDCTRKFVQFNLTVIFVTIAVVFLGSVLLGESPLSTVQILWVNFLINTLAIIAFATEPTDRELLTRKLEK